ncbi:unnamed protein product, partial [Effrenium voratum]
TLEANEAVGKGSSSSRSSPVAEEVVEPTMVTRRGTRCSSAPIDLGDWMCVLEPIMADPSVVAQGGGASGDMVREVPDDATIGTEK